MSDSDAKLCQNVLKARHAELAGDRVHARTKGVEREDLVKPIKRDEVEAMVP